MNFVEKVISDINFISLALNIVTEEPLSKKRLLDSSSLQCRNSFTQLITLSNKPLTLALQQKENEKCSAVQEKSIPHAIDLPCVNY
ncbi:hypothetical protein BLOT_002278 [Blomia tropicalis]|nr:hypothetical protein BLOT_002278 [Blomia tropicalis]